MFHLHHETLNQADIATGDAQNRCHSFLVRKIVGVDRHTMAPTLIEKKARLIVGPTGCATRRPLKRDWGKDGRC